MGRKLPWNRILIRSGFRLRQDGESFDLSAEYLDNRKYLKKLYREYVVRAGIDPASHKYILTPDRFVPGIAEVDEDIWLDTVESIHGGAEGGYPYELFILDTYMAGLVRAIDDLGLKTCYSCDGHDSEPPSIGFNNKCDEAIFFFLCKSTRVNAAHPQRPVFPRQRPSWGGALEIQMNRRVLPDFAEQIVGKQQELRDWVKHSRAIWAAMEAS